MMLKNISTIFLQFVIFIKNSFSKIIIAQSNGEFKKNGTSTGNYENRLTVPLHLQTAIPRFQSGKKGQTHSLLFLRS